MLRIGLGGPGPTTLLFRRARLGVLRSPAVPAVPAPPAAPAAALHSSALEKTAKNAVQRSKPPYQTKGKSRRAKPGTTANATTKEGTGASTSRTTRTSTGPTTRATTGASKSSAKSASTSTTKGTCTRATTSAPPAPPETDSVIYLPPPIDHVEIDKSLELIRDGISTRDLNKVVKGWSTISLSQATDLVPDDDYAPMSEFLARTLNPPNKLKIRDVYQARPAAYGMLASLALEAGARGHMMGLIELSMQLAASGLPLETTELYERYRARVLQLRGMTRSQLSAVERHKRLAARIGGDGVRLFLLVHIGALTLLKQFDPGSITSLLNTTIEWNHAKPQIENEMRHIVASLHPPDHAEFMRAYRTNVRRWELAVTCHHTPALLSVIRQWARIRSKGLVQLYEDVVEASTGRDRIMIPTTTDPDFATFDSRQDNFILLPMRVWIEFIIAFEKVKNYQQILKIINVDLPILYDNDVPHFLLATGMAALSAAPRDTDPVLLRRVRKTGESLWARLEATGAEMHPGCVALRIETLCRLGQFRRAEAFYHDSVLRLRLNRIPHVAAWLDPAYIVLCVSTNNEVGLMKTLETRASEPVLREQFALGSMIAEIVSTKNMRYTARRKAVATILSRMHPDVKLSSPTWGRVLSLLLEKKCNVPNTIAVIAAKEPADNTGTFWTGVLGTLMLSRHLLGGRRLDPAIHILTKHILPDRALSDFRLLWAFRAIADGCFRNKDFSADARHEQLLALVALVPADRPGVRVALVKSIMRLAMAVPDGTGVPEALYWWKVCNPSPSDYTAVVGSLITHGQRAVAAEIAAQAPPNCSPTFWRLAKNELGIDRPQVPLVRAPVGQTLQEAVREDMDAPVDGEVLEADVVDEMETAEVEEEVGESLGVEGMAQ